MLGMGGDVWVGWVMDGCVSGRGWGGRACVRAWVLGG
jgi:hypothetical protein